MSEGPSITADAEDDFLLLSNREDAEVHADVSSVSPSIRGRLRAHLPAWESIGASDFVLNVISHGFKLPFITEPAELLLPNHSSALEYSVFVSQAVQTLLDNGSAVEVDRDQVYICSPLGVVPKKNGKLRLILDLRYLNGHLAKFKFKYEDLHVVAEFLHPKDWFFTFDLKDGYHHVDIYKEHWKFLGFSLQVCGTPRFFTFCSLPFGLSVAPYVFTKLLRPVVAHWRSDGIRISVYLDDGIGACTSQASARSKSTQVHSDLVKLGFLINEDKSDFNPRQHGEHLGFALDLEKGQFSVPSAKVEKVLDLISNILDSPHPVTARHISRLTGSLISMSLALGPIARLRTRHLYALASNASSLSTRLQLPREALDELSFWRENFSSLSSSPIWRPSPKIEVLTFSDASSTGWGGFVVNAGQYVARGNWSGCEALCSSAFREIRAVRLVLQSLAKVLEGKECRHRSDNQSVCSILSIGSRVPHLQREAVAIYSFCHRAGIRFSAEWIPRHLNTRADYWSKVVDTDDWKLNPQHFKELDELWGPHTVDRFASHRSAQLPRFCSRWWCPGTETVDAFTVSWEDDNNWLVPPVFLIPRVIRHMRDNREHGTLIVPYWPSAPWWPLLYERRNQFRPFVADHCEVPLHEHTFLPGSAAADLFGTGVPSAKILALRLVF